MLSLALGVAARGNREPTQFCIVVDQRPFAAARGPSQDLDKPPAYGRGCATHVLLAPDALLQGESNLEYLANSGAYTLKSLVHAPCDEAYHWVHH